MLQDDNKQSDGESQGTSRGTNKTLSAQRLKQFIARVEKLEEEKKALTADIKEVYSEAKSAGFDPKIMRKVIAIRKMDPAHREEEQSLIGIYLEAVGD